MKRFLLLAFIASVCSSNAQVFDKDTLAVLKKQGKLNGTERVYNPNPGTTKFKVSKNSHNEVSSTCNCWINRDASFSVVPMDNPNGGNASPGSAPNYENDDGSSNAITLPFNFCLYGTTYNSVYINNNGNVSFGTNYSIFSAVPFPSPTYTMVAPFWGDVDTRGAGSGYVYYKLTNNYLIVQWDSVGYYDEYYDKRNTFQLIMSDGTDPILPAGNNISFCYGDMQWTTGDASGGTNGFGGTPATVGINKGDGTTYTQLGLFDHAGTTNPSPSGTPPGGVSWLDNKSFIFNACGTGTNLPPIATGVSYCGDTLTICSVGDTLIYTTSFQAPELNQIVTCTGNGGTLGAAFSVLSTTSGVNGSITFMVATGGLSAGYYNMTVTGTDNYSTPASTTVNYVIHIINASVPNPIVTVSPSPACLSQHPVVTLTNCSQFDTHVWSNGDTTCSFPITTTDTLYLTVTKIGCYKSKMSYIKVSPDPVATVGGVLTYCPPTNGTTIYVNQPLSAGTPPFTYNWDSGAAATDTLHNATNGTHSVVVTDVNGCKDTVNVTVTSNAPGLTISAAGNLCTGTVTLSPSITTGLSYSWSPGGATTQNISVNAGGVYTCSVVVNSCTVTASYTLSPPATPVVSVVGDTALCPGQTTVLTGTASPAGPYTYHWYNSSTNIGNGSSQTITSPGTGYSVVGINTNTQCRDSITFSVNQYQNPSVNISGNPTICGGKNDTLTAFASGGNPGYTYLWHPGNATTYSVAVTTPAVYSVTVTDSKGCKDSTKIIVKLSTPLLHPSAPQVCPGYNTVLHANGSSGTPPIEYLWKPSLATTSTYTTNTPGIYTVTMTDFYGCTDTKTVSVSNYPLPNPQITYDPPSGAEAGDPVAFTDASTITTGSVVSDHWNFGDTSTATNNTHPSHVYANGGHYVVTLIVKSDKGCLDTVSVGIDIEYPVTAPNIITPNGDNTNELLEFKNLLYFKNNKIWIYNRWGKLLYQSNDYKNDWSGKEYVDGTYYYILQVPDKKKTFKNFFTLIR
ncbi:MAG: nidogen-like domain-containing protein [Bacteroidia bacterium]